MRECLEATDVMTRGMTKIHPQKTKEQLEAEAEKIE